MPKPRSAEEIFDEACALTGAEREAYLRGACGNDAALRCEVESLLKADAQAGSFLREGTSAPQQAGTQGRDPDATLPNVRAAGVARSAEQAGQIIGRFKLLQQIGEGGFGSVWMAEQREPVVRKVALKIIKLGMDTRQVIARFEAERQALALMDHPNIAKVLDAGATDTGRPYFVMELCTGQSITDYCDRQNLTIPERLELFAQVCQAVQHAHQKGLIHRDIKPSNILVATQDGRPHASVIDFGIAKATASRLTEKTLFTEHKQLIGTPQYMSPEQAEGSLDIDTRTDVYSLGVLLYELLTGATPFDPKSLRSAVYAEIQRIIREVEPPKPSTRLNQNTDTLASVAARRHVEPNKLGAIVRGELDWIVMKALEKDRQRRYETANGLAMDIRRYLAGEVVVAAPPSRGYRFRKFVRRNRIAVSAGGAVAAALMIGAGVSIWFGMSEARQRAEAVKERTRAETNAAAEARSRARADAINKFVTKALESSDALQSGKKDITIAEAMHNAVQEIESGAFEHDLETDAALRDTIGLILKNNGKYTLATPLLERALAMREHLFNGDHPDVALSLSNLGALYFAQGQYDKAEPVLTRSLAMFEKTCGPEHPDVAAGLNSLAVLYYFKGQNDRAEPLFKRALALREKTLSPTHRDLALTLNDVALMYSSQRRYAEAEPLMKRSLAINEQAMGPDHPDVAASLNSLATLYDEQGEYAKAEPLYQRALAICEKALDPDHPLVATALHNLAENYRTQQQYAKAESPYTRALAIYEKALGPEHAQVAVVLNNLAVLYKSQGRLTEAEPLYLRSLAIDEKISGGDSTDVAAGLHNLGAFYEAQNQLKKAEEMYRRSLAIREKLLGPDHLDVGSTLMNLALLYGTQGHFAKAEPLSVRAVANYRKTLGPDHVNMAVATVAFARIQQGLGNTAQARQGFDQAIAILRRNAPDGSPPLARTLWRSATARLESKDKTGAAVALGELKEAVAMAEKRLPSDHPHIKEYRETLAQCQAALADPADAAGNR